MDLLMANTLSIRGTIYEACFSNLVVLCRYSHYTAALPLILS